MAFHCKRYYPQGGWAVLLALFFFTHTYFQQPFSDKTIKTDVASMLPDSRWPPGTTQERFTLSCDLTSTRALVFCVLVFKIPPKNEKKKQFYCISFSWEITRKTFGSTQCLTSFWKRSYCGGFLRTANVIASSLSPSVLKNFPL